MGGKHADWRGDFSGGCGDLYHAAQCGMVAAKNFSARAADFLAVYGLDSCGGGGAVTAIGDPLVWVQDVAHECFYLGRWDWRTAGVVL